MAEAYARRVSDLTHYDDSRTPFAPEIIDAVLWEVAVHGGNVRKAMRTFTEAAQERVSSDHMPELPSEGTVRRWVRVTFRNRYSELLHQKAQNLDERRAQDASLLALAIEEAERKTLTEVLAGLGSLDAVEASTVLRNLAQSKKLQADVISQARGTAMGEGDARDLMAIARSLARFGAASIESQTGDLIEDATVVG